MILSENRFPLFGLMRYRQSSHRLRAPPLELAREPQRKRQQHGRRDQKHRHRSETVKYHAAGGDSRGLPEIKRRGEDRDRGAAGLRRHLGGVGLQRVVQHVEAEPDGEDGGGRHPVMRLESEREVGERQQRAAAGGKAGLAEAVDQRTYRQAIDQAADREGADEQADQREPDAEAQMQIGADIGEGADLHLRFGVGFTLVGLFVGAFAIGGLIYSLSVRALVNRFGQTGLAAGGGALLALAYLTLAFEPHYWMAPAAILTIGLGFYMLHNTLQTNATQMTPQARGTAVAIFSASLYLGQTAGVAAGGVIFDRFTAVPVFLIAAAVLLALALWFARQLKRRRSQTM